MLIKIFIGLKRKKIEEKKHLTTYISNIRRPTAGCWWLVPIILATQEAEIKRIKVQSESGQIVSDIQF
jgi:hypothetical protein